MISKPYRLLRMAAALSVVAAMVCLPGCNPTLECGAWNFNGTPSGNSFPLSSAFNFSPTTCGQSCNCTQDVMIQIVTDYDTTTGTTLWPSSAYAARADANGWSIDRIDGEGYGYYGLINDGKTFDPFWNTPGANGTPNTLFDDPSGWPANTFFYAVDVAVCFNSDTCNNKILGYYIWSWFTDSSDNGQKFIIGPAWQGLDTEFQSALSSWNTWAPTSGAEGGTSGIAGEPSLTNAVTFPAMSDL